MTYDPALTAVAATTNDALTDHLWRLDIDDMVGHLAANWPALLKTSTPSPTASTT